MTESRRQLQERWLDAYLVSPVWRFVLAGGSCGADAYAGVLLPSVDLVGRYFPFTIVARWEVAISPLMTACSQEGWFELVQALALEALDAPILDFDDFDRRVAALGSRVDPTQQCSPSLCDSSLWSQSAHRPEHWHVPPACGRSVQSALSIVAFQALERTLNPISLWWTEGSNDLDPVLLCVSGLPDPGGFAAMLSGQAANGGR
jgi:type VI secretion system protein ImpM